MGSKKRENGKTFFYQSEFPYDVDQSYGEANGSVELRKRRQS